MNAYTRNSFTEKADNNLLFLENLLSSTEAQEKFFNELGEDSSIHESVFPKEVICILNNPVLFDCNLPPNVKEFWIDEPEIIPPIIYKADPTVTAAFAFGVLAGKVAAAGAVGAAGAAGVKAVRKK